MPLSPFFVFEPASGPEEIARLLAYAWAERVLDCADELDDAERRHEVNLQVLERMDFDFPPDESASFRRLWVANHTLIWSCAQLRQWLRAAISDVDDAPFEGDLRSWRNALEHLDESSIEGAEARANEALTRPQSIRAIGSIRIGNAGSGSLDSFATTADIRAWVRPMIS